MSADGKEDARPTHARPRLLVLVFLGGALGTMIREALVLAVPAAAGIPWTILAINLVGTFVLGFLIATLGRAGAETPARRDIRLFAGTGVLGGFTTYSALATDSVLLLETAPGLGVAYALVSLVAGIALAAAGMASAGWASRGRSR